jgi:phospholipase/carboxylesterase
MKTMPDCIEINPSQKEIGSVIWLHGLGADGNDFVPIVQELNLPSELPLRFVFPHAPMRPVTINNGYVMRAWFDIYNLSSDLRMDNQGVSDSIQLLETFIDREVQRGVPIDKIVLAGFSQGAVIALSTGLRYPKTLAGMLALSGCLPNAEKVFEESNAANFATPIFVAHGTQDAILPYLLGLKAFELLEKNKYPATFHSYEMGHGVCEDEIGDIANWLMEVYQ